MGLFFGKGRGMTKDEMTGDLFPESVPLPVEKAKAKRASRRVLMHVSDAGTSESGQYIAVMSCRRCGISTGWLSFDSVTDVKRGIACVDCNGATK